MSRTRKRAYSGSKRFDTSCRCHGSCEYCRNNRLHSTQQRRSMANEQLREYRREN